MNNCYYCGNEAKFQFKNGKWCCSKNQSGCPKNKELKSKTMEGKNKGRKRTDIEGDKNPMRNSEVIKKISGEKHYTKSKEYRKWFSENNPMKNKESLNKISNNNCHLWKGGTYWYLHKKAWELFGNEKCEICGITNEDHIKQYGKRLHMHCGSHNYSLLEKSNWLCCCNTCHGKLEG